MATATIEVDEKVAAALRAQAEALHIPLSQLLQQFASTLIPAPELAPLSDEEFDAMLEAASGEYPVLPDNFSREDIYFDHD